MSEQRQLRIGTNITRRIGKYVGLASSGRAGRRQY